MNAFTLTFILVVALIGVYAFMTAPKRLAVAFLVVVYGGLYLGLADTMGKAKPILLPDEEVTVLAYHFDEPDWIYLWVLEDEPTALRMGWDVNTAKQLRRAAEKARGEKRGLKMRRGVPEGESMFYLEPPKEYPPK